MNKNVRQIALYLLIIVALAFFVANWGSSANKPVELKYSPDFVNAMKDGRVKDVTVLSKDRQLNGHY